MKSYGNKFTSRLSGKTKRCGAKAFESKEFEATAGGGAVRVTVVGGREVSKITLDKDAVDPDDVEMLEDLIKAAVNEALRMAETENQQMMGKLTGGLSF